MVTGGPIFEYRKAAQSGNSAADESDSPTRRVLLVESLTQLRERLGDWLSDEGFDVLCCPGPKTPDYTCLGGLGLPCPLAAAVEVVVLDGCLASDIANQGTPAWQLLDYYVAQGKKVLMLVEESAGIAEPGDGNIKLLNRYADRETFIHAVKDLFAENTEAPVDEGIFTPRWVEPGSGEDSVGRRKKDSDAVSAGLSGGWPFGP